MSSGFTKPFIIYGLGTAIVRFVSLILIPIYTRVFSASDYGLFDLLSSGLILLYMLGMLQLESGFTRFYHDQETEAKKNVLLNTLLLSVTGFSVFIGLVTWLFSGYIISILNPGQPIEKAILLCVLTIPFYNIFALLSLYLRFLEKPVLFIVISLFQFVIMAGSAIFFVVYLHLGLNGVFAGTFIAYLFSSLLLIWYLRSHLLFKFDADIFKRVFKFSLPQLPSTFFGWINNYANRFIIVTYLTLSENGIYSASLKISSVFLLIDTALRMTWGPFFWKTMKLEDHKTRFKSLFKIIVSGTFGLLIIFTFFSRELFAIVTPEEYWSGGRFLGILALSNVIYTLTNVVGMGPDIVKKTHLNMFFNLSSLILNLVLMFVLIPVLGIITIPISILVSNGLLIFLYWFVSERLYHIGYPVMFFMAHFAAALFAVTFYYFYAPHLLINILLSLIVLLVLINMYKSQIKSLLPKWFVKPI